MVSGLFIGFWSKPEILVSCISIMLEQDGTISLTSDKEQHISKGG